MIAAATGDKAAAAPGQREKERESQVRCIREIVLVAANDASQLMHPTMMLLLMLMLMLQSKGHKAVGNEHTAKDALLRMLAGRQTEGKRET